MDNIQCITCLSKVVTHEFTSIIESKNFNGAKELSTTLSDEGAKDT